MKIAISIVLAFAAGLGVGVVLHDQIASAVPTREKAPPEQSVRVDIFATVDRAAVAMEQSMRVGINFVDFSERVIDLATEVALAERAIATPEEGVIWQEYSEAKENARDIVTAWNLSLNEPLAEGIHEYFKVPSDIFEKHTGNSVFDGLSFFGEDRRNMVFVQFRQYVWEFVRKNLENARNLTNAPQSKR